MLGGAVAPRRWVGRLGLLCCIASRAAADPGPGADPDAAELERVFKQRPRAERAPVMLVIDGVEVAGDGPVMLELARSSSSPLAPSVPVIAALAPRLAAHAGARLRAAVRDHHLSVDALRAIGLEAVYDPRRLELRIDVPPSMAAAILHDLGGNAPDTTGALAPSKLSGYINLHGGAATRSIQGQPTTRQAHLNSDAAINVLGWVLEGRGDLAVPSRADESIIVHRGDVLLTRDVERHAIRFVAGDLAVPSTGLQASYPILGVGLGRNFALQPYKVLKPIGSFDFVIDRPSTVTVLVNDTAVQTLQLPAGRHDVRDLPLGSGVNNVELVIKDDAGITRRIAFSVASPDALLAPGITQFSLNAGFPRLSDVGLRTYDDAHPIVSGRFRAGVTSMLTLGATFDSALDRQVGGASLAIATSVGNLSVDAAGSRERTGGSGVAVGARYDYSRASHASASTLAIVAHRYSPGFRGIGPHNVRGFHSGDAAIAITRKLSPRMHGRLDLRYQVGRDAPDVGNVAVGVSRSFGSLGLDASISTGRDPQMRDDVRLFVTAHWRPPRQRAAFHVASRTSRATGLSNEAAFTLRAPSPAGGFASSLRLRESSRQVGMDGTASYGGHRFTTSLALGSTLELTGAAAQTASLDAATALAFAGGRFAWSRPIAGSFAVVERNPALGGAHIGVNPVLGNYAAATDAFGPAVLTNLESYRITRINVEAPALPVGSSLGPSSYALLPTYRSGTLLRVGEDGTVCVRGILLHYDGEALGQVTAELVSLDDARRAPVVLMTNRVGRFSASGLRPGRYALRLAGDTMSSAELEIPAETTGVYSVGIVEVK
jgi:outer membrane usher protein